VARAEASLEKAQVALMAAEDAVNVAQEEAGGAHVTAMTDAEEVAAAAVAAGGDPAAGGLDDPGEQRRWPPEVAEAVDELLATEV